MPGIPERILEVEEKADAYNLKGSSPIMPEPRQGEKRSAYISRCMKYVKEKEGGGSTGYRWHKCKALWAKYHGKTKK